jgi:hypothetical protein
VDLRAGLDDVEKRKFLILPGLELRPLGRPALLHYLFKGVQRQILCGSLQCDICNLPWFLVQEFMQCMKILATEMCKERI